MALRPLPKTPGIGEKSNINNIAFGGGRGTCTDGPTHHSYADADEIIDGAWAAGP